MSRKIHTKIHTMELRLMLSLKEYHICEDFFYRKAKGLRKCCYPWGGGLCFRYWSLSGVNLYLHELSGSYMGAYLDIRVNPSKLLDRMEPQALFEITEENHRLLMEELEKILKKLPIEERTIQSLILNRLDLCEDFPFSWTEVCLYIQLLNKGVHHTKWKEHSFGDERDNHSFRRECKRYQITVYDKVYQMQKKGLITEEWEEEKYLLRVEAALKTEGLRHLAQKYNLDDRDWTVFLPEISKEGEKIFRYVLLKLLPEGHYYSLSKAREIISESNFYQNKKKNLIEFLTVINQKRTINLQEIRSIKNGKKRLRQLAELQINPVTIVTREQCVALQSIPSLISPSPVLADEIRGTSMYCSIE